MCQLPCHCQITSNPLEDWEICPVCHIIPLASSRLIRKSCAGTPYSRLIRCLQGQELNSRSAASTADTIKVHTADLGAHCKQDSPSLQKPFKSPLEPCPAHKTKHMGSDLVFCLAFADGDYKLTESAIVVEYLDKKYGKAGKSLLPDDAEQLGKVLPIASIAAWSLVTSIWPWTLLVPGAVTAAPLCQG